MSEPMLDRAIAAISEAQRFLAKAKREHPAKGSCAIRAVIDVSLQDLGATKRHLVSANLAAKEPTP